MDASKRHRIDRTYRERQARERARARAAIEACLRIADPAEVSTLAEARDVAREAVGNKSPIIPRNKP
jgi:hypothetical protein